MWYRVFCRQAQELRPDVLTEELHSAGFAVVPHFRGDDLGWSSGELHLPGGGTPVLLARYLTKDEDLRADLNAFAAELETLTYSANSLPLMERIVQTMQLITVRKPVDAVNESLVEELCERTCRAFAETGDGVYQIDGRGWYATNGTMLIREY